MKSNCWLKVHWSSISSISKVRLGGILVCVSWGVDILSCGRIQSWLNWTKVNTKNVYESSDMLGYSIWLKALHLWYRMLIREVNCPNTPFQSRHPKHGEFAFPRGMDRDAICHRMSRSIGDVVDLSKFSILCSAVGSVSYLGGLFHPSKAVISKKKIHFITQSSYLVVR